MKKIKDFHIDDLITMKTIVFGAMCKLPYVDLSGVRHKFRNNCYEYLTSLFELKGGFKHFKIDRHLTIQLEISNYLGNELTFLDLKNEFPELAQMEIYSI